MLIQFEVPFPPSSNTAYPTNKQGRRFLSDKGKAYKAEVGFSIRKYNGLFKKHDRLSVTFVMFPPDKRKRDICNYEKLLMDCFTGTIFPDDEMVDHFEIKRGGIIKGGLMEVLIKDIDRRCIDRSNQGR